MKYVVTLATPIYSYLSKASLRHTFSVMDNYNPPTLYLREQECENWWLFSESVRGPRENFFGNTDLKDTETVHSRNENQNFWMCQ
jgi:hypothetical protein